MIKKMKIVGTVFRTSIIPKTFTFSASGAKIRKRRAPDGSPVGQLAGIAVPSRSEEGRGPDGSPGGQLAFCLTP